MGKRSWRGRGHVFAAEAPVRAVVLFDDGRRASVRVAQMLEQHANVRALADGLRAGVPQAREGAARALLGHGPEVSVPILRDAARDPAGEVRALACRYLAEVRGDPSQSVPVLIAAADDRIEDVGIEMARGLGRVARYRSVPKGGQSSTGLTDGLAPALRDECQEDPPTAPNSSSAGMVGAGGMAAMSVGGSTGPAVVPGGGQGNPRSVTSLLRIIADAAVQRDVRENAVAMVRGVNPAALAKATPDLVRQLADADPDIRRNAIDLLSLLIDVAPAELPAAPEPKQPRRTPSRAAPAFRA